MSYCLMGTELLFRIINKKKKKALEIENWDGYM